MNVPLQSDAEMSPRILSRRRCVSVAVRAAVFASIVAVTPHLASAVGFPTPVEDVLTLDVPGGSVSNYSASIPASVKMVVKVGAGEAVLLGASSNFSGRVEIREGTLRASNSKALGQNSPIEVTGNAATLDLNFYQSTAFAKHNLTIRGQGVGGKGALRLTRSSVADTNAVFVLESLSLSGDARIAVSRPFGIRDALNLRGHTLTRIEGKAQWRLNPSGLSSCTIDAGVISNMTGQISFYLNTPTFTSPDLTSLHVVDSELYCYQPYPEVPCRVAFVNGRLTGIGSNTRRDTLSGPVMVDGTNLIVTTGYGNNQYLQFVGETKSTADLTVCGSYEGHYFFNGPFTSTASVSVQDSSRLFFTSNVTRRAEGLLLGDRARADLCAGVVDVGHAAIGSSDGGDVLLYQTNGSFLVRGAMVLGERAATRGAYLKTGGLTTFGGSVTLGAANGAQGVFWGSGGDMWLDVDNAQVRIGDGGRGFLGLWKGARFGLSTGMAGEGGCVQIASADGGMGMLSVSGTGSVFSVEQVRLGVEGADTQSAVVLTDGGTLKAGRFLFAPNPGPKARREVTVNGGRVCPTRGGAWNGLGSCGDVWTVGPNGLTIDTSEVADDAGVEWSCALKDQPSGGIAAIDLPAKALETRGPAFVDIRGPAGSCGAWAMAEYDAKGERLSRIVVIAPGSGYDKTTKTVLLPVGGASATTSCAGFRLTGACAGGRLVKRGRASLTMRGTNAYTGGTVVEEGTLIMSGADAFPANTPLEVVHGATFSGGGHLVQVSSLSGCGTVSDCTVAVACELRVNLGNLMASGAPLTVGGAVSFADGACVKVEDPENLPRFRRAAGHAVLRAAGGFSGAVPSLSAMDSDLSDWTLVPHGDGLKLCPRLGMILVFR